MAEALRANIDWKSAFLFPFVSLTDNCRWNGSSHRPFFHQESRTNDVSCIMWMWAHISSVISQSRRLTAMWTDRRTERVWQYRALHYMQPHINNHWHCRCSITDILRRRLWTRQFTTAMNNPSVMCVRNPSLNEIYAIRDLSSMSMQLYVTVPSWCLLSLAAVSTRTLIVDIPVTTMRRYV